RLGNRPGWEWRSNEGVASRSPRTGPDGGGAAVVQPAATSGAPAAAARNPRRLSPASGSRAKAALASSSLLQWWRQLARHTGSAHPELRAREGGPRREPLQLLVGHPAWDGEEAAVGRDGELLHGDVLGTAHDALGHFLRRLHVERL